jgi:arylsulfatase A-like enzyme
VLLTTLVGCRHTSRAAGVSADYSAANICSPSRGALMTGRMYGRLGIFPGVFSPLSNSGLLLNETTIATALKSAMYTTGMVGKWCAWHARFPAGSLSFYFAYAGTLAPSNFYQRTTGLITILALT